MGMDRMNTESAILARLGAQEEALAKSGREAAKLPYDIAESVARAKSYEARTGPSDADQKAADEYARYGAMAKGAPGTPAYSAEYNRLYQEHILRRSQNSGFAAPANTSPLNRGTL